jgi:Tfp pilus assembly protein PilN
MIEINLLPGAGRKARGRGTGASLGATLSGFAAKVKDPHLIFGVVTIAVCVALVAAMQWRQTAIAANLDEAEQQAVQDSVKYAAILNEKRAAESRRDSVLRQLGIIKAIDNNRFVWPHVMDEVSRVMPPYTWLNTITQAGAMPAPAALQGDSAGKKDSLNVAPPAMKFRLTGITVDIQALTRFMKDLEASAFVQNVVLDKSTLAVVDGKEVTEFQLSAEYQTPDSSAIRLQPIALSVR